MAVPRGRQPRLTSASVRDRNQSSLFAGALNAQAVSEIRRTLARWSTLPAGPDAMPRLKKKPAFFLGLGFTGIRLGLPVGRSGFFQQIARGHRSSRESVPVQLKAAGQQLFPMVCSNASPTDTFLKNAFVAQLPGSGIFLR